MANQDSIQLKQPQYAKFYESHVELYHEILHWFMDEEQVEDTLLHLAKDLQGSLQISGYDQYSYLLGLRLLWNLIRTHEQEKEKISTLFLLDPKENPFHLEDFFCLLLHHRYKFSVKEIASVTGKSEGTILTKLKILEKASLQPTLKKLETPPLQPLNGLQKFPFQSFAKLEGKTLRIQWQAMPWYLRIATQAGITTAVVLLVLFLVPAAKKTYETWIEKRPDLYTLTELIREIKPATAPTAATLSTPKVEAPAAAPVATVQPAEQNASETETEFIGKNSEKPSSDKVYRILIKSEATPAIRNRIMTQLNTLGFQPGDESAGINTEIPGGIIFDVYVDLDKYSPLFQELSEIGETKTIITRARYKTVKDKVRVKIWLQTQ